MKSSKIPPDDRLYAILVTTPNSRYLSEIRGSCQLPTPPVPKAPRHFRPSSRQRRALAARGFVRQQCATVAAGVGSPAHRSVKGTPPLAFESFFDSTICTVTASGATWKFFTTASVISFISDFFCSAVRPTLDR